MVERRKCISYITKVLLPLIMVSTLVVWAGCKKPPAEPNESEANVPGTPAEFRPVPPEATGPRKSLNEIIQAAKTWMVGFKPWLGKPAPDFTLTDIAGKEHKLSDYRGKNVLIVFWATWCPPCQMEIPGLIELRKTIGEDKLAVLAISYITTVPPNTTEIVKTFTAEKQINYTVISVDASNVPAPYNAVKQLPSSFFIDPQGKIKLSTIGLLSLDEIKAILQAA